MLRDELKSLTSPLITFVLDIVRPEKPDAWVNPTTHPLMLPYRTPDGRLNYLSVLAGNFGYLLGVNIPLGINVTTDFRRDLVVPTRNGSKNIRTFAGNDVIHRGLDDPDCRIDGGLGINTVVYPGKRANWIIGRDGTKLTVRPRAGRGTDTLVRVQFARFDDVTVDLNLPE